MPGAVRYTTTELLNQMKRTGHIPPAQTAYTDADLLALADEETTEKLLSVILTTRENYYITHQDLTLTQDGIYDIPKRAIAGALDMIQLVNGTSITRVDRSEISEQFATNTSPSGFYEYHLLGNKFKIVPVPQYGVIRVFYTICPNVLCLTSAAAQVTAINSNILTFSSIPQTFTTETPLDAIKDQPYFDFLGIDLMPVAVGTSTIEFTSAISGIEVGDWLSLAGTTPVPQIPKEFRSYLSKLVAQKFCEIQGYKDKLAAAEKSVEKAERDLQKLINPRVAESPKRIVPDGTLIGGYNRWKAWRADP